MFLGPLQSMGTRLQCLAGMHEIYWNDNVRASNNHVFFICFLSLPGLLIDAGDASEDPHSQHGLLC